ncbi:unnamed protein product [Rhizophagus irregularis]|nr:unnamed protein product [Rhizophagus irregularis]
MVALKELNNSKNITPEELNELKIFYDFAIRHQNSSIMYEYTDSYYDFNHYHDISNHYGITKNPITQNFVIVTDYYEGNNLTREIAKHFSLLLWNNKSAMGHDEEIYGIIPYIAPEILKRQNYTIASDIYGFGMIMWELMTGRRPFWDHDHDTDLIIKICDGFRPPIVTNAPEGYVKLMQRCWHSDPNKRSTATELHIGPVKSINPGAIYKSRSLSEMIKSAESTRSLESINSEISKNKFEANLTINDNDYSTKEIELDIDNDTSFSDSKDDDYVTEEINFDI